MAEPRIHIEHERLTFHTEVGVEQTVKLREHILDKKDVHGALLWAIFHRLHAIGLAIDHQNQLITASAQDAAAAREQVQGMQSPEGMRQMMKDVADMLKDVTGG